MKPSSSPPRARRSGAPIAAPSTTRRRRRSAAMRSQQAVKRAGVDPAEIDDVVMGAAMQQGSTYMNVARQSALRAGLPTSVAGMSVDRQCASGLMAIAIAAKQIVCRRHADDGRRRPGIDFAGAERARQHLSGDAIPGSSRIATTSIWPCWRRPRSSPQRYEISRERAGRICAAIAAAHRRRAGGRAVRRRDRAACRA